MDKTTCPKCGNEQESGYVASESLTTGAKWMKFKKVLGTGGEIIAKPNKTGMIYIPATRCQNCKTISFQY